MFLLAAACALASVILTIHAYVGLAFWRIHRNDLTRLSVYVLTHQPGLIANFAQGKPRVLSRANSLALDVLSFPRLMKMFLAWPWYVFRYREVLAFARFTARVLGDERTDALVSRLEDLGLQRADSDDLKAAARFGEGFLVRRLDDELVAVFWHEEGANGPNGTKGQVGRGTRTVVPFRVPAERRVRTIADAFKRWGFYSHVAEGQARASTGHALPYVVVFEPYTLGAEPALSAVVALARSDAGSIISRFVGDRAQSFSCEFAFDTEEDNEGQRDRRAERAYRRFFMATQTRS